MINLIGSFASVMTTIGGIAVAIVILLIMITIHEFGHYIAGRKLKFKINEFAIGFGPKIISKKNKHGIDVSLRALPLGGFCAFEGEDEDKPDNPEAFNSQKPWRRMIVLSMGAIFNIVSAIIFSFIVLLAVGDIYATTGMQIQIGEVYNLDTKLYEQSITSPGNADNPNFGVLQKDDIIISVNGTDLKTFTGSFSDIVKDAPDSFEVIVIRNITNDDSTITAKEVPLTLTKWTYEYTQDGKANAVTGIGVSTLTQTFFKNDYNVGTALRDCVPYTFKLAGMVLSALGQLFTPTGMRQMGGTVTTIAVMGKVTTASFAGMLNLLPLIAVNLGVFNLLPVPALDGSRILFCGVESIADWIAKRRTDHPLSRSAKGRMHKIFGWAHAIGFVLLIGFVIVADILQLFVFKQF